MSDYKKKYFLLIPNSPDYAKYRRVVKKDGISNSSYEYRLNDSGSIFKLTKKKLHRYHMVTPSPWPFLISVVALSLALSSILYMHYFYYGFPILLLSLLNLLIILSLWWRDVIRESTFEGKHTLVVQQGLKLGFILFIISEVMFFFAFFWAFFHCSTAPSVHIGCTWPPYGIVTFNPLEVPFLNTCILLLSGATITFTHHSLITGDLVKVTLGFLETLLCAVFFTIFQLDEYLTAPFTISDGIYGSVFYMITGLHGFHVIVGTIFIFIMFIRYLRRHFTRQHHLGFEFAAWYWHFVDVVWLYVYIIIYWWGSI